MKRKDLPKSIRFEVFKRDSFTCQYCGRMAPDVVLEVDHINPVANGGTNDIINLVTSCKDCNRGKGKKLLSDNSVVRLQQEQVKELAEKMEQLEMLIKWRKELSNFDDMQIDMVDDIIDSSTAHTLNENGRKTILKIIKKYGINEVCDAASIYVDRYFDYDKCEFTRGLGTISSICENRRREKDDPSIYWVNKVAYAVNRKFSYVEKWKVRNIISGHIKSEEDCNYLLELVSFHTRWKHLMNDMIEFCGGDN